MNNNNKYILEQLNKYFKDNNLIFLKIVMIK